MYFYNYCFGRLRLLYIFGVRAYILPTASYTINIDNNVLEIVFQGLQVAKIPWDFGFAMKYLENIIIEKCVQTDEFVRFQVSNT